MNSDCEGAYELEDICRYLIANKPEWITDDTPTDIDDWHDWFVDETEPYMCWSMETDYDTFGAEICGWNGIYVLYMGDEGYFGPFLNPDDAVREAEEMGCYEDNEYYEHVTVSQIKDFDRLSDEDIDLVKNEVEGPYLDRVLAS